ncbi:hypothetical protein Tco_1391201 [Tanacetum coccineum]
MTPPLGFSTPPQIPNITTNERQPVTTIVFAATTSENTPFAYHAFTLTNPNPTICPAFEYDEEQEMEPRPEPRKEATQTLRLRSPRPSEIEAREGENKGANLPPLLAAHLGRNENSQLLRSSLTFVQGGHQPLTNFGGNHPPNGTLLSHLAQPLIPSSLHIPTRLVPIHVNPYSQPSMNLVHGQAPDFLFQTQTGNPPAVGTFTYQGGYIP